MTATQPPFSSRTTGPHSQIDNKFPTSARIGLVHLLIDLVDSEYISNWAVIARELHRISRLSPVEYNLNSATNLKALQNDAIKSLDNLSWEKCYDFCERLYTHLPSEVGYHDNHEDYIIKTSRGEIQAYIAGEIQRLFLEERLAYEFDEGTVRRRGRKHTTDLITRTQVVLGNPELQSARRHYEKALQFFRNPTNPDYENSIKEAVCAVEAAGKILFPTSKASTLGDLIKWLRYPNNVAVPKAICQTFEGIYAFRSGGEGIGHGGTQGGKATLEVTEYVLALSASQIIYLVDIANASDIDVPF
ncbi:hypothetical protein [Chitinimonas sp. JJ19]|uniref:hypothetical protein n=1 Tax=Chitinimonas sp. JJ19 TaxID=3109352 RepID=UPI0030039554